ncbi:MAG: hypothetical protein ACJ77N_03015 [Chloroflexota bacterium]
MDRIRSAEAEYRISHRHSDGSYWDMEEVAQRHDPGVADPERSWLSRRIFRCRDCDELVTVAPADSRDVAELP